MLEIAPRTVVGCADVMEWIERAKRLHSIEGVTFLGGEPMLQARGLCEVAGRCRELGLSVMVFTGYTLGALKRNPMPGVAELLSHTDLLVDGPFNCEEPEHRRNWAGSTGQRFHFLTSRYEPGIELDTAYGHSFEVRVFGDGVMQKNGWPSDL
jgi:anaerobic ribonucleoside-triphosphate reductase activating protein